MLNSTECELCMVLVCLNVPPSESLFKLEMGNAHEQSYVLVQFFFSRHAKMNFTKNPDKYLKYSPDSLDSKLRSFFDGGV